MGHQTNVFSCCSNNFPGISISLEILSFFRPNYYLNGTDFRVFFLEKIVPNGSFNIFLRVLIFAVSRKFDFS